MDEQIIKIVDGKKNILLFPSDIRDSLMFVTAGGNYIDIIMTKAKYKSVRLQIGQFEKMIESLKMPHQLVRIDRSTMVNLRRISFINPAKNCITVRGDGENVQLQIAKAAFPGLKDKVAQLMLSSTRDISTVYRKKLSDLPIVKTLHEGHPYIDLGLPSGNLWSMYDMSKMTVFGITLFDSPYKEREYEIDSFENHVAHEYDAANVNWGGKWRTPSKMEWQELLDNTNHEWRRTEEGFIILVLTGKNGNQIYLSSIVNQRGLCTYWTSSEDELIEESFLTPRLTLEMQEAYDDEPWFHFASNLDMPECNIHPVLSASDL